jgi:hypothetical protein
MKPFEVLAGATLDRLALAERLAQAGEVIIGAQIADRLGEQASVEERRTDSEQNRAGHLLDSLRVLRKRAGVSA